MAGHIRETPGGPVTFPDAVKICFNKYVDFNGRARRSEFWWWALFTFLLGIVASIIDAVLGTRNGSGTGLIGSIVNLAVLLPSLAVGARRLHDTGRSGWWQLLWIVICIGWIFLIIWYVQDSQGDNKYGPSPKPVAGGGPYGQPPVNPYGQPPADPYGQPPANPYGQPPANPYGDPPTDPGGEPPAAPPNNP
jgi:uncharacterized membrane protein YhaH (DUF805 family)